MADAADLHHELGPVPDGCAALCRPPPRRLAARRSETKSRRVLRRGTLHDSKTLADAWHWLEHTSQAAAFRSIEAAVFAARGVEGLVRP